MPVFFFGNKQYLYEFFIWLRDGYYRRLLSLTLLQLLYKPPFKGDSFFKGIDIDSLFDVFQVNVFTFFGYVVMGV